MKTGSKHIYQKSRRIKPIVYIAVMLINVLVFMCIGAIYMESSQSAEQKLFDENINSVDSLNTASANAAYTYMNSMGVKINDIVNYIESESLDVEDVVTYLGESNTDPNRQFQLILNDKRDNNVDSDTTQYSGISIRKVADDNGMLSTVTHKISYERGYTSILDFFTGNDAETLESQVIPEFTDPDTKQNCFAVYRHTPLTDAAGNNNNYTVLLAVNSQTALNAYNMQNEYKGQSTVLINQNGEYIIKSNAFRNTNFYDYIVNYNGLQQDKKSTINNQVLNDIKKKDTSNLFYKNHAGEDCVFSVSAMNKDWYSVTCVPLVSFDLKENHLNYSLIIMILFFALFAIDGIAIYLIGKIMNHNIVVAERATREANKANQAKSRFLSTMSHELRTPLNAIIGFASLSEDNISNPSILKEHLKKINISSKLLLQLISDILDVSAIESNKLKINSNKFDISKLITSLSAIYYDQCASKGIEFDVILKNINSEMLIGDYVRVNQILLNFLSNAVKFTPSGGQVTLKVETISRQDSKIILRFEVSDTGCGISDELKPRLFKPFERAEESNMQNYRGTGLGLSIAKTLAELMHGSIGIESCEGAYSCFWVEIPFSLPPKSARLTFSPISGLRLLAVINNAGEREYVGNILSNIKVSYTLADNADEALKLLRSSHDSDNPYNMCILDWKLFDLNALDATRIIRREFDSKSLHIMIFAYDFSEAKSQCLEAGADSVFTKPVFSSSLYNKLEEISTGNTVDVADITARTGFSGKRVLLVEDNKLNTEVAILILNKFSLNVETAENGLIGYEMFAASAPGYFDVILIDIQMPVMNGYKATAAIRASKHPDAKTIPILAMTADVFSEDIERAHQAGMNEHIAKPIEPDNLYPILKTYLGV